MFMSRYLSHAEAVLRMALAFYLLNDDIPMTSSSIVLSVSYVYLLSVFFFAFFPCFLQPLVVLTDLFEQGVLDAVGG